LNSTELVDPGHEVPSPDIVIPAVEDIYQRLFAILVAQNIDLFQAPANPTPVSGVMMVEETRIFMNQAAFIISILIMGLNILVLAVLYIRERSPFLPRLPSTIGSLIAYVAASRLAREYGNDNKDYIDVNGEQRAIIRKQLRPTYSFGSYLGVDGKTHVGIELDPFVMPIRDDAMVQHKGSGLSSIQSL
jgi:hypothetical protein